MKTMKEIWEEAQTLAAKRYEAEEDKPWEEADKYEREDYVFYEFTKLKEANGFCDAVPV